MLISGLRGKPQPFFRNQKPGVDILRFPGFGRLIEALRSILTVLIVGHR